MRCNVVVLLLASLVAATHCKIKSEALRIAIGKFLKASFDAKTDCLKSSNASEELVAKYWDHEYNGENDQSLKCYLRCSYLKTKIVDEKGTLNIKSLTNKNGIVYNLVYHKPQVIENLIEYCKDPKSLDVCESAYQLTECGFKWFLAT